VFRGFSGPGFHSSRLAFTLNFASYYSSVKTRFLIQFYSSILILLKSLSSPANIKGMKKDIHPKYYPNAKVKCACGNTFEVGSTKEFIEIEICSKCHPFYTGKEKIVDAMGRVEKFKKRLEKKVKHAN